MKANDKIKTWYSVLFHYIDKKYNKEIYTDINKTLHLISVEKNSGFRCLPENNKEALVNNYENSIKQAKRKKCQDHFS